jgi:hypothetical protein
VQEAISERPNVGDDAIGSAGPLRWRRTLSAGPPIVVEGRQLTPVTRVTALTAHLGPAGGMGVIVRRPAGVRVAPAQGHGEWEWMPIVDLTRWLWWALLALALGLHLLARAQERRNRHAR